jgi:AcrR family transcriptional regulator
MDSDKATATKTRILAGALALFNAHGVGAMSALDIATALGISPGHLYYHFKGKPELLAALAAAYQFEVDMILKSAVAACRGEGATLETLWTHVHILAEEAWDARFLYREAGALALRYPDLAPRIRRIVAAERETLRDLLIALAESGAIAAPAESIDSLARLMTTAIGFHAIELELEGDPGPDRDRVARAVAHIMRLPASVSSSATRLSTSTDENRI